MSRDERLAGAASVWGKILPSGDHRAEHQAAKRAALLAEVDGYIRDSGDGEFAVLLGDALEALPEVQAYRRELIEVDQLYTDPVLDMEAIRRRLPELREVIFHRFPELREAVKRGVLK